MECATGDHVTRNSGYIDGSDEGLKVDVCKIDVKCNNAI